MNLFFLLLILFGLSVFVIAMYRKIAIYVDLLDHPNHRSSHEVPTPRGAGLVFVLLWILVLIGMYIFGLISIQQSLVFSPVILILLFGFIDDYHSISAKIRFTIQVIASLLSLWYIGGVSEWILGAWHLHLGVALGTILALLLILWSINLFNFMDGIDGIAGLEALFVLLPASFWLLFRGGFELSLLMWSLSALVLGFLMWNWPKAKVFMGDCGSSSLGFLLILFALIAQKFYEVSILSYLVLYGLFLFDATITLLRRIARKENWTEAHRSHAYQRMHLLGWSHAKILRGIIVVNLILSALATAMNFYPQFSGWGLLMGLIVLASSYAYVERLSPMFQNIKE